MKGKEREGEEVPQVHVVLKKALAVVPEHLHPSEVHLGGPSPRCPMQVLLGIALHGVELLAQRDGDDRVRDELLAELAELRVPINASGMRRLEFLGHDDERIAALQRGSEDVKGDSRSLRAARRARRAAHREARDKHPAVATLVAGITAMVATMFYDDGLVDGDGHADLTAYLSELDQRLISGEAENELGRPVRRTLHRAAGGVAIGELVVEVDGPAKSDERYAARVRIKRRWTVVTSATLNELLASLPDAHFSAIADSVLSRANASAD